MAFDYQKEKPNILTDEGQAKFLKVRHIVEDMLSVTGAVMVDNVITHHTRRVGVSDSTFMLTCIYRMVELKEIREVTDPGDKDIFAQHRVFVKA